MLIFFYFCFFSHYTLLPSTYLCTFLFYALITSISFSSLLTYHLFPCTIALLKTKLSAYLRMCHLHFLDMTLTAYIMYHSFLLLFKLIHLSFTYACIVIFFYLTKLIWTLLTHAPSFILPLMKVIWPLLTHAPLLFTAHEAHLGSTYTRTIEKCFLRPNHIIDRVLTHDDGATVKEGQRVLAYKRRLSRHLFDHNR